MNDWNTAYEEQRAAMTPDQRAQDEVRLSGLIVRMATAAGTEIRERPAWPGAQTTYPYAEPSDGIRYALMIRSQASQEADHYIRLGRQDGMTWRDVGVILNPWLWDADPGGDLAAMAFEHAAGAAHALPFDSLSFYWRCPTCDQDISDRGPYESHPEDNEHGHAEGCARMAADVAAHEARRAEWEG